MFSDRVATESAKINVLTLVATVLAGIASASFFGLGIAVPAVFAVGAGHVALNQIKQRGERGAVLAYLALVVGYGMAIYALVSSAYFWIALVSQAQG